MSIPAPEKYLEDRGVEQARLNFNRSAQNASAWLRMRTGGAWAQPGRGATKMPAWLGGGDAATGGSGGSLPASVNNMMAAAGVPSYANHAPVTQDAIDAAQKQFQAMQGSSSVFSKLGRGIKTGTNLGLQVLDFPVEFVRNQLLATARDVTAFVDHPAAKSFWEVLNPDIEEAVADTTVNAFINTIQRHGIDYALGPDGIGTGYTLDPESAAWKEKEDLAAQFYTLSNGDPATLGRWLTAAISSDPESTFYKTFSGIIDATTLLLDPLNLIAPEAKIAKAERGVEALADLNRAGEIATAAEAVRVLPGVTGHAPAREAYNADLMVRAEISQRYAAQDPELLSVLAQAEKEALGTYTGNKLQDALFAADVNEAGLQNTHLIEAHKALVLDADTATEGLVAATNRLVTLRGDIYKLDESLARLDAQADELALTAEDAAKRGELAAEKADLEAHLAAQEEANAQFTAIRQEIFKNVDEREALARQHEAVLATHTALDEEQKAAGAALHNSGQGLLSSVYDAMDAMPVKNLSDTRTGLRAMYGLSDAGGVNMRTALNSLARGKADATAEVAARVDDFHLMSEMFREADADTIHAMVAMDDPQDILMLLAGEALNGNIGKFTNRAKIYLANRGERIGAQGARMGRIERRFQTAIRSSVPAPDRVNIKSRNETVKLVKDQIDAVSSLAWRSERGGAQQWWGFRAEWVNRVADADGWVARKKVVLELQDELVRTVTAGLDKEDRDEVLARLGRLRDDQRHGADRAVTARAEMAEGKASDLFGYVHNPTEQINSTERLIRSGVDLSTEISILDSDVMRQLVRRVDEAQGLRKAGKWTSAHATALNDMFDSALRPLYLVFRPGYVALQVADGSTRSLALGATSMLSHPLSTVGLASSMMTGNRPGFYALMDKLAATAPVGADGLPMFGHAQRQFHEMGLRRVEQTEAARYLVDKKFRDFAQQKKTLTVELGWEAVENGAEGFHKAWAEDALRFFLPEDATSHDPMFQAVLSVRADADVPKHIMDWATERWGGSPIASMEDVVTEYFFEGPGRSHLMDLASSARTREGVPNWMQWVGSDRNTLRAYLFDPAEPFSVHSRAAAHTGGFDRAVVDMFRDIAAGQAAYASYMQRLAPRKAHKVTSAGFTRDVRVGDDVVEVDFGRPVESWAGSQLRKLGLDGPAAVERRASADVAVKGGGAKEAFDRNVDGFFGFATRVDKFFGQVPYLFDETMRQTAKRVGVLSQEDARAVYDTMMAQMPKHKSAKLRETQRVLKAAVAKADGDGSYTIDAITQGANRAAFDELKNTMYGMKGRSESAKRMALLWPFLQASANGYRVFSRAVAQNPTRAVNAARAWENAKTEDSGVIYDVLPGVHRDDPTQPLVHTDAYGNQLISIPFLGYLRQGVDSALGLLPFYTANPMQSPYMDVNVSKWNPANYGEPLPGVGMGVTIPASAIDSALGGAALPTWMEQYIHPYQPSDVSQDQGFIYSNAPWFVKALMPSPQAKNTSIGTAMSALMAQSPDAYADPSTGYITQEGASRLTRDATDLAVSMQAMGQVWAATFRGGMAVPKTVVSTGTERNGQAVATSIIYDEWNKEREATSSGQAYSMILDHYGTGGLAYLIGKRDSSAEATDQGYQFARANPDVLGASPDVLGYFFPASDLKYQSPGYDRLLSELGRGKAKSPEDYAEDVNRALWQARVGNLDAMVADGQITASQYKTTKALLSDEYGVAVQGEFNTKRYEQNHLQLRTALTNQELLANPVGMSLAQFYQVYDMVKPTLDGETFTGKKDARQRQAMLDTGEALARANPAFQPLWDSQLKWEFRG